MSPEHQCVRRRTAFQHPGETADSGASGFDGGAVRGGFPFGRLMLTASARGLTHVDLVDPASDGTVCEDSLAAESGRIEHAHLRRAERALERYFAGSAESFNELALAANGTAFQRSVWDALRTIPAGTAISYRALAERIGKPNAIRASAANGRNPLPIIVPCHRVIGADRRLTGFGLGIAVKAWLLVHEGAAAPFPEPVTAATRVSAATGAENTDVRLAIAGRRRPHIPMLRSAARSRRVRRYDR